MTSMALRNRVIAFFGLICLQTAVVAQWRPDQTDAVSQALRAGQIDTALQLLRAELQQNPTDAKLLTLEGLALSGKNDEKGSLAAFQKALTISPNYLPALEGAAQIEYARGSKDVEPLLRRILEARPNDLTSHAMLAEIAYLHRDCATSVSHFEQSGSLLDSEPGALQEYGDCLLHLKQTAKAISVFNHALEQPNADNDTRLRLASAELIAHRPKDAIATLHPLVRGNSTDADALELASSADEADGNTPEAVRILRQAIVANPHDINLYIDFAELCLDHRSYAVGIDMLDIGLKAEPSSPALYAARGVLYVQVSEFEKAEADFEKADDLDPRQSVGLAGLGLAAEQKNDPERALATVQAKLAKHPNDAFLLYVQADILQKRGPAPNSPEFRLALQSAEKSVALRPSLSSAHDVLAKLYLREGQNQPAIRECRAALSLDPKDQTALYRLAMALRDDDPYNDVPKLLQRLADLRAEESKEEIERNRYKFVEDKTPVTTKTQP
jgi:tetratricopeptide (TPR) repeat protein